MRDPFAPINIVSVTDPAVIFENEAAREKYRLTRDPSLYRVAEGREAAVFSVQPLHAELAIKLDHTAEYDRALLAFRTCVHSIKLPGIETPMTVTPQPGFVLGTMAPVEWVREAARCVGTKRVAEIGEAAYRLSMMEDIDPLSQPPGQPPQS